MLFNVSFASLRAWAYPCGPQRDDDDVDGTNDGGEDVAVGGRGRVVLEVLPHDVCECRTVSVGDLSRWRSMERRQAFR